MLIEKFLWIVPLIPAVTVCLYSIYDCIRYSIMMEKNNEKKHSCEDIRSRI